MPKTKKDVAEEILAEEPLDVEAIKAAAVADYVAENVPEVVELGPCGHINKHYYQEQVLTDLLCTREEGHEGDHSATFTRKYIEAGVQLEEEKTEGWNDAAGIPASEITQDVTGLQAIQEARKKRLEQEYLAGT